LLLRKELGVIEDSYYEATVRRPAAMSACRPRWSWLYYRLRDLL
jgi:hypothetical protein